MRTNRREFLKISVGAASSLALMPAGSLFAVQAGDAPRLLPAGEHLFLDDYLIAGQNNLTRVIEPPARLPDPIVKPDPDMCFQPYLTVNRDPETKRFRMWYNSAIDSSRSHIAYMESEDGVKFIRPHRDLDDPSGLPVGMGAYVVDDGPSTADPTRRFKLAWEMNALYTAFSPDGLSWQDAGKRQLSDFGDIISLSYDPIRKHYLLLCKAHSTPEDGYKGSTPNAKEGYRRLVGQSVSNDCITWSPVQRIIAADAKDEGITEFYSIGQVIARGGLLIGLLKVLRDDLAHEPGGDKNGIGYTCLAWTRDGKTWHRDREPFMDRNPQPGTWDRAMTWGDCPLVVNDEIFIYYGGYARGHKVERMKERQIGFARMKRDRFVSRRAAAAGGTLRTPVVSQNGSTMTVNADIAGELRVRVLDATGAPIKGFDAADCTPLKGDSLRHKLQWKRPLAELRDKPVQLEFIVNDARLYGFDIVT